MGNFKLHREGLEGSTGIPNNFIEDFMPQAAGEFVKIYIYLLKCVSENCRELSISRISDVFNNTEKDTVRALKYWERRGLLKLTFDDRGDLTSLAVTSAGHRGETAVTKGAYPDDGSFEGDSQRGDFQGEAEPAGGAGHAGKARAVPNIADAEAAEAAAQSESRARRDAALIGGSEARRDAVSIGGGKVRRDAALINGGEEQEDAAPFVPERKEYSRGEVDSFSNSDENQMLIFAVQRMLGREMTPADINLIMYLRDSLGFSQDLTEYLFEYCIDKNKTSTRYIEKTGIAWAKQGITDVKGARMINALYSSSCYPVMKAFGLTGRDPSEKERKYINKWTISYGFGLEMILEAVNRTVDTIHKPSFEYADSILKRWKSGGIMTPEDVAASDAERSEKISSGKAQSAKAKNAAKETKFNSFSQRSYDYEELEERLVNK